MALLLNQRTSGNHNSQNSIHSADQSNKVTIFFRYASEIHTKKKKRITQNKENESFGLTSNGNIVSPPSSTLDKYNKKEAICEIIYQGRD